MFRIRLLFLFLPLNQTLFDRRKTICKNKVDEIRVLLICCWIWMIFCNNKIDFFNHTNNLFCKANHCFYISNIKLNTNIFREYFILIKLYLKSSHSICFIKTYHYYMCALHIMCKMTPVLSCLNAFIFLCQPSVT